MTDEPDLPLDDLEDAVQSGPQPIPRKTGEEDSVADAAADSSEPAIDATLVEPGGAPSEATMLQSDEDHEPTLGDAPPAATGGLARKTSGLPKDLPTIPDVVLKAILGTGGQGAVYRGHQEYLERQVAVKILHRQVDPSFAQRFQREAKILAGLLHPNIVVCHQAGVTNDNQCYMVMEFIDGPDLHQEVTKNGPLNEAEALSVVMDIAQALAHGNESAIIHRDVKPQNVLLQGTTISGGAGQRFRAKLADLGLARCMDEGTDMPELTAQGAVMGTPSTMAPEQFDSPDDVDHRTDIYGLGCVLFFAATGSPAFKGGTLSEIYLRKTQRPLSEVIERADSVSEGTRALLRAMLAPSADDRPQTYKALIDAIAQVARGQTPSSIAVAAAPRRHGLLFSIGAVMVAAGALAFMALSGDDGPDPEGMEPTGKGEASIVAISGGDLPSVTNEDTASPPVAQETVPRAGEASGAAADGRVSSEESVADSTDSKGPTGSTGSTEDAALGSESSAEFDAASPTGAGEPAQPLGAGMERWITAIRPRAALDAGVTFEPFSAWDSGPEMFDGWILTNRQRFGGEEDFLTRVIGRQSGDEPRQTASRSVPKGSWSLTGALAGWESMTSGPAFSGGIEFIAAGGTSLMIELKQPLAQGTDRVPPRVTAAWRQLNGDLAPAVLSMDVPLGIPGEDEYAAEISFALEVRGSTMTLAVNGSDPEDISPAAGDGATLQSMTLYCVRGITRWRDFEFTGR